MKRFINLSPGIPLLFLLLSLSPICAADQIVCVKTKASTSKIKTLGKKASLKLYDQFTVLDGSSCPSGYSVLLNTEEFRGDDGTNGTNGADGADGADGSLRIYGDGSAGEKNVTVTGSLTDTNFQYTDFTVGVGVTLSVDSGTVIRCTGTFTNNGTITVAQGAKGASMYLGGSVGTLTVPAFTAADPGISLGSAANGEYGASSRDLRGGAGGVALSELQARNLRYPGARAGGSGGGTLSSGVYAGDGGGSLVILCRDGVENTGSIGANGGAGNSGHAGGGGGGGVIILASPDHVTNSGSISAVGGVGVSSETYAGAAGGGGGGIVHMISPSLNQGSVSVTGGSAGATTTTVNTATRSGGGGGGACGGNGGGGAWVDSSNNQSAVSAGSAGLSLLTVADPTSLF